MNRIFHQFLYSLSLLPLPILYRVSDFSFVILFYIIGYRKRVVLENLTKSFPKKSQKEIKQIRRKFYRNLCDFGVETIKAFSISQKELDQRHTYSNLELFDELKQEKKNVFMLNGHVFNWEWYIGTAKHLPIRNTQAVYHEIHNKFWNDKINALRARFGTKPLPMNRTTREVLRTKNDGDTLFLFIADQSPFHQHIHYELNFMNQPTPVFNGFDALARKLDISCVYTETVKIKRGHYHTSFIHMKPKNEKFEENEVTHAFFELLSKTLHKDPANWLWSHKRWKYRMRKT